MPTHYEACDRVIQVEAPSGNVRVVEYDGEGCPTVMRFIEIVELMPMPIA